MNEYKKIQNDINKTLSEQFKNYKNNKLEILNCSTFNEFYESKRITSKDLIIDYYKTFDIDIDMDNYSLIALFITKEDKVPISHYIFLNHEKNHRDFESLLSLRFEEKQDADETFMKYRKILKQNDNNLILNEVSKDIDKNEWDLY